MSSPAKLLLNPRLTDQDATRLKEAWRRHGPFPEGSIGIVTSGSTSGLGSIVILSQEALEASALGVNAHLGATAKDVWGLALPTFHVGGYGIPVRAKLSGSRVAEWKEAWEPVAFAQWLAQEGVTLLSLVPTQLFDLVQAGIRAPAKLRAIVVGGARLEDDLRTRAHALGWPALSSYGMTESSSQIATAEVGSDGQAMTILPHAEIKVLANGRLSVQAKSLLTSRIVFDQAGHSQLEHPVVEGWFEASDRGRVVGNKVEVFGREGDVVKVLGELVDVAKLRSVLASAAMGSPFENHVTIVARPDQRRGFELLLCFEQGGAVLNEVEMAIGALIERTNTQLMPFERIQRAVRIDAFPRSELGKILYARLSDQLY